MKKVIILSVILLVAACGICKNQHKPSEQTIVHYVDSTIYHDSTVYHTLYKERYNDFTSLLDTLRLSTTYSNFSSWVDTTNNVLKGTAENKDIDVPVEIKWKEKIEYRDSIQVKEVPVEVVKEVTKYPTSYWWFLGISILAIIYIGIKIYLKFKVKL